RADEVRLGVTTASVARTAQRPRTRERVGRSAGARAGPVLGNIPRRGSLWARRREYEPAIPERQFIPRPDNHLVNDPQAVHVRPASERRRRGQADPKTFQPTSVGLSKRGVRVRPRGLCRLPTAGAGRPAELRRKSQLVFSVRISRSASSLTWASVQECPPSPP